MWRQPTDLAIQHLRCSRRQIEMRKKHLIWFISSWSLWICHRMIHSELASHTRKIETGSRKRNTFEQSHSSQVERLDHMHIFVWAEISFPWVRWMIIAPKVSQKTADEFTTAIKLSAICKRLGIRFPEVKYILERKKLRPSVFGVSIRLSSLRPRRLSGENRSP